MQDKKTLLRQKWVEALESGDYNQIRGNFSGLVKKRFLFYTWISEEVGYCAVGVLNEVGKKYGFGDSPFNRIYDTEIDYHKLWWDNDKNKLTFPEIAAKLKSGEYDQ